MTDIDPSQGGSALRASRRTANPASSCGPSTRRPRKAGVPSVLAAIVNFERANLTIMAVRSLLASGLPTQTRLVVIDNGSQPSDVDRLNAEFGAEPVEIVRLASNGGYAAAVNHAVDLARDDGRAAVWVMNNDLEFAAGIGGLLRTTLFAEGDVAAVAPVTLDAVDRQTVLGAGIDLSLARGRIRHRGAGASVETVGLAPYGSEALEAACLMIRMDAVEQVGRFDEGFFMYWEDTEWSFRALRAGWRLLVAPGARVWHQVSQSSEPAERMELMIRNRIRFVRMTASAPQQAAFMVYMLAVWLPTYVAVRLGRRLGWRTALSLAARAVAWNVADARRHGWDLRRNRSDWRSRS